VLELLTGLLLAVHLLAMNHASAGPLVCLWLGRRDNELRRSLGRQLAWSSVIAFLVGMATGGLMLLSAPGAGLQAALGRFPASAYWFAGAELLFSFVLMIVIARFWESLNRWIFALLALATATNLLYHFPPMMAVIGQLAADPRWTNDSTITRPVMLQLMARGEVLAFSFHFALSSFAVTVIAVLQLLSRQGADRTSEIKPVARSAAGIALAATLIQIPVGLWLLMSLPATARSSLIGTNIWASVAFMAALVTSIGLLQRLVMIVLGETDKQNLKHVVSLLCGVVLLMTLSLRLSRPAAPVAEATTKTASDQQARG
jgi:hypothetical protein